jgi:uncharacterized protein YdaT
MGMTIDKAKEWLKLAVPIKALTQEEFATFIQAVNLAVDTMEKYQKIEDIYYHQSGEALENSLRTVIEDGKID